METQNLSLPNLLKQAKSTQALEWQKKLTPLLELLTKKLRGDKERISQDYLREIRRVHSDDFLEQMRSAAEWARANPDEKGVEHINAICHLFYTELDLNYRLQRIFNTFIKLGEEALSTGPNLELQGHPQDDLQYDLIRNLKLRYRQIKAVPNDAKAPLIKQWANSVRGHLNGVLGYDFDPNAQSNPVHVFMTTIIEMPPLQNEKEGKKIFSKDIAMGSPTIEKGDGAATINEEMLATLRHYKKNGQVHLYINHQDCRPKSWVKGDESVRCQAIHALGEGEFKGTFYPITLCHNSPFYYQLGHDIPEKDASTVKCKIISQLLDGKSSEMRDYLPEHVDFRSAIAPWMAEEIDSLHQVEFQNCKSFDPKTKEQFVQRFHALLAVKAEELKKTVNCQEKMGYSIYQASTQLFKEELIKQLFDGKPEETGNWIPEDLKEKFQLKKWGCDLADHIHKIMFDGRDQLSAHERRVFIRLVYNYLARQILICTEAYSFNKSCKDRIDRGAASDAEAFAEEAILNDLESDPELIKFFEMFIFARSIVVRKRVIIEERLERLIETTHFMLENKEKLKKLFANVFPGVKLTNDFFLDLIKKELEKVMVSLK